MPFASPLFFALLSAAILAFGCSPDPTNPAANGSLGKPPMRIVALTVGSVDSLALLGQLERVIAVEEDCFVPGTEHLVKIRNDDHSGPSKALNVEAVLALHPDLIIAKEDLKPALENRGIAVLWVSSSGGLDTVIPLVEQLGRSLGAVDRARMVLDSMREKMASIERRVAGLPRVRVYYEAGKPGRTAGRGTLVDDMIRLAGGDSIAGDSPLANPLLSSEAIVALDPEVIVLSPWSDSPEEVALRPGWSRISAVIHGRVHRISEENRKLQYPSPSCVDGCESMLVPWIHPSLAPPAERK
ncbi:MAG TPA: ABC transporter substrate-binding protein [Planctomycetota bacterium]|nr:ABC transporter substrate-binding protein [Planctomycetota bacterium]